MKINAEQLDKVSEKILGKVVSLIREVEKLDNTSYGNGHVQSAILAELFAAMYNDPSNKVKSVDKMVVKYEKR